MHDGSDDGPRRSRRTRTDDPPARNGEVADGPDDDVLGRYGLREANPPRDDSTGPDAAGATPWPPRSRRADDPLDGSPGGAHSGTNGQASDDPPGRARSGRYTGDRRAADPAADEPAHREPGTGAGTDRTDALPPVAVSAPSGRPGRPGRRRRGATESRNTQVMPAISRRRARDDDPDPPAERPALPRQPTGPSGPPRPPAAPPDSGTPGAGPNGAGRNGAPPNNAPPNGVVPAGPRADGAHPGAASPPAAGGPVPDAEPAGAPARAAGSRTTATGSARSGRVGSEPPSQAVGSGPGAGRPTSAPATPDAPVAPEPPVAPDAGGDAAADGGRPSPDGEPGNRRRRPGTRPAPADADSPAPAGPGHRLLRIGGALIAVVVLVACASGFTAHRTLENGIRTVAALDPESDAISSRATQAGDENILVLGLPADRAGVPEAARTDTAVLVHQPADGAAPVTLGFPPMLEVARPPCQRWDPATGAYGDTVPAESRTAFSAAYDVGGPKCAVGVVQQVTGLAVTRFVAFDLAGVSALVGAVRGVGVCTERPVVDRVLGPVAPRPGDTVLGGAEAERFTAATGVDDASPVDRVRRQQRVLSAALDRALSTSSLLTPGTADRVARALPGALTVDGAGTGELLTVSGALSRAGGADAAPPYVSLPVNEQPNTRGHLELNRRDSSDLFSALQKHEPLPPEFTVPAQRAGSLLLPQGTVVDVLNAAGRSGLADEIATGLRAQGYAIGAVSDAPPTPDTTIRFSPDRADASGVLGASVPSARPQAEPGSTGSLQLVLGASFPGASAISAPTRAGTVPTDCG